MILTLLGKASERPNERKSTSAADAFVPFHPGDLAQTRSSSAGAGLGEEHMEVQLLQAYIGVRHKGNQRRGG